MLASTWTQPWTDTTAAPGAESGVPLEFGDQLTTGGTIEAPGASSGQVPKLYPETSNQRLRKGTYSGHRTWALSLRVAT